MQTDKLIYKQRDRNRGRVQPGTDREWGLHVRVTDTPTNTDELDKDLSS